MKNLTLIVMALLCSAGCEKPVKQQVAEGELVFVTGQESLSKRLADVASVTHPRLLSDECSTVAAYFKTSLAFGGDAEALKLIDVGPGHDQLVEATQGFTSKFLGAKPRVERLSSEYEKYVSSLDHKNILKGVNPGGDSYLLFQMCYQPKFQGCWLSGLPSHQKMCRGKFESIFRSACILIPRVQRLCSYHRTSTASSIKCFAPR